MSCTERPSSSSSAREIDPLLKDLSEKQQSFRLNVVSLVSELKEVRDRLASLEQSFARETLTRQEAEIRAKNMEAEIWRLQKNLEERNGQLLSSRASVSAAEMYLEEVNDLRSQLSATQAIADASAALAQSAQLQCLALLKENSSLKEHKVHVNMLGEQLDLLQKDLPAREFPQKQLKDEVLRKHVIMKALAKAGASKDSEVRKLLDEVSPNNFEKNNKLLITKDEEIAKLRDEIRIMSIHWNLKMKDLES